MRRISVNAVKESLDDFLLGLSVAPQGPDFELVAGSQRTGNCDYPMQVMRQKIAAGLLAAGQQRHFSNFVSRQFGRQVMQTRIAGGIGDGLNIECENG